MVFNIPFHFKHIILQNIFLYREISRLIFSFPRKHSRLMLTFPQQPQPLQQPQLQQQQLLNLQQPKAQLLLPAMIMTIPTRARKPKMILLMMTKRMFLQLKILRMEMRMTKLAPPQSQSLLLSVSSFFLEELQLSFFFITRENFHKVSTSKLPFLNHQKHNA